jgi:FdhE protein
MRHGYEAKRVKHREATGGAFAGVKTPEALVPPDPATRFASSATRLEALSAGHPMMEWLRFMAQLVRAQHVVATTLKALPKLEQVAVVRAVDARMPPLAPDRHRRDATWLDGLAKLLDAVDSRAIPAQAGEVMASLRERDLDALEAMADDFIHCRVDAADAGAVLFVVAALQVYFTRLAATLPASSLRLLPQRGLCPCCGSTPVSGVVTASGQTPGTRYLYCSLCSTAWNYVRAMCVTCGQSRSLSLKEIEADSGAVKAETCGECHTYAKMFYQARDMKVDPFADDLATLGLDVLVANAGWARHAPNPLLLIRTDSPS